MAAPLVLGTIVFQGHEIPDSMPFGGDQMLAVRKLPGGARDVQAMGRDDSERKWSGRFHGPDAEIRGREVDTLRIAGTQQVLSWAGFRYTVVIGSFHADYQNPVEVPYSISCVVISDLSNPIVAVPLDVDFAINTDLNAAAGMSPQIISQEVVSGLAAVSNAAGLINTYKGASSSALVSVNASLATALTAISVETNARNTVVQANGSVAGIVGGQPPQALAGTLLSQAESFQQLGILYQTQSLLGRARLNIANAGS